MKNLFELPSLETVYERIETVRAAVDESGFAIIRGAVPVTAVEAYKERVRQFYTPGGDVRISGHYKPGSKDLQRLDLGEYSASSRFARYFFFFPWNEQGTQYLEINRAQIQIFNRLARQPLNFGLDGDADPNRFRVSFVIQYPLGGGFMSRHREYSKEKDDKAYVVYLALTTRGVDYASGGGYVVINDTVVDIEQHVVASDLVVYRGDMFHGVQGVDRDKPVQFEGINGRMILTTQVNYFTP